MHVRVLLGLPHAEHEDVLWHVGGGWGRCCLCPCACLCRPLGSDDKRAHMLKQKGEGSGGKKAAAAAGAVAETVPGVRHGSTENETFCGPMCRSDPDTATERH